MPPIAQRLREPAAFVLLAFGALSTLFHTITFLFGPGEGGSGLGGGVSFSDRAALEVMAILSVEVTVALVGAVWLAHAQSQLKNAKLITLVALIAFGVMDLFGVVALFSSFGANQAGAFDANGALFGTGWGKTQMFFVSAGELAVAGIGSWLVFSWFQQHQPAKPAQPVGGFQQPQQQWGPGPQPPQQQWQQQPPQQQAPQGQPWGPPPPHQQAPQQPVPQQQPPQPQWGQPQPQHDADAMMTQAIPTVPPAPQGQQQPPQQDGGLPIGNWTSE
ncbi:hypothetical protein [Catenulispora rubra]|uniref:hypothetical protein n=1 Tax=Catenulispora rubra TaxID=280293 RepID=UPI0018926F4D|nr:hypothetical protein [Catenulispora rubra]